MRLTCIDGGYTGAVVPLRDRPTPEGAMALRIIE